MFRYLCGTTYSTICYQGKPEIDRRINVHEFVDFDWASDPDHRVLNNIYVFKLFGGEISWMIRKQSVNALSTTEAEYMASTHACKEVDWLQILCSDIRFEQQAIRLYFDSQSTIFLEKNLVYNSKRQSILIYNTIS